MTGNETATVTKEKADKIMEWKYGKNGGVPQDPKTPIELENFGTVELRDIKMIKNDTGGETKTLAEHFEFERDDIKEFENEIKQAGSFEKYCVEKGYIFFKDRNMIVNKDTFQQYNMISAKFIRLQELRRQRKYMSEQEDLGKIDKIRKQFKHKIK